MVDEAELLTVTHAVGLASFLRMGLAIATGIVAYLFVSWLIDFARKQNEYRRP